MSNAQKIESQGMLRSPDNVTRPVSVSSGDDGLVSLSLAMTEGAYLRLEEMARVSNQDISDIVAKAFILYEVSPEAFREGKSVGIAPNSNVLETEFVGL